MKSKAQLCKRKAADPDESAVFCHTSTLLQYLSMHLREQNMSYLNILKISSIFMKM